MVVLFPMQIYTNFESNSQLKHYTQGKGVGCFRCKFTQILKAIHNPLCEMCMKYGLFPMQIYTNFESNSQPYCNKDLHNVVVSDANLHKFWKQFTTILQFIISSA